MKTKQTILAIFLWLLMCSVVLAETRESEFALFKRTISPVYRFGENGVILMPKADTIGKWNFYAGINAQEAGKIEDEDLYLTAASLIVGTSDDVEIGYTSRQFIWENMDKTDINMDTYHIKARIFHLADNFLPQVSMGVNAVSISSNEFDRDEDILFNPYLVATLNIPIVSDQMVLSVSAAIESVYNEGDSGEPFYSFGLDLQLFEKFYIFAETQGISKEEGEEIFNIGAKYKLWWLSLGITMFNVANNVLADGTEAITYDSSNIMAHLTIEVPLGSTYSHMDKR